MTGFIPSEGQQLLATIAAKRISVDRDADMELLLFTNASVDHTTVYSGLTEPSGNGYARKILSDASWTSSGGVDTYAQQSFQASGGSWTGVRGYAIVTKSAGGTRRILCIEVDPAAPSGGYTIADQAFYKVTPRLVLTVNPAP
jgi:hypothetical protein